MRLKSTSVISVKMPSVAHAYTPGWRKCRNAEAMPDSTSRHKHAERDTLEPAPVDRERERHAAQNEHPEAGRRGGVEDDAGSVDLRVARDQRRDADALDERERVEPEQRGGRVAARARA